MWFAWGQARAIITKLAAGELRPLRPEPALAPEPAVGRESDPSFDRAGMARKPCTGSRQSMVAWTAV